jgi:purine nucleosidase
MRRTRISKEIIAEITKSKNPAAQYLAKYADEEYRWDELAAASWLDPSIITKQTQLYMDMDYSHGAGWQYDGMDSRVAAWVGRTTR